MTQEVFTGPIQQIQGKQVELTVRGINPTLNREGNIFMSDAGINTEGVRAPQAPTPKAPIGSPPSSSPTDLRGEWMSVFSPRELQNIDTRRTIDAAVELGFGPAKVTSRGRTEQTAQSVVENAGLDSQDPVVLRRHSELANKEELTEEEKTELYTANADRLSKAEGLLKESLGRELTDAEKKAILKAHFVGLGEKGKNEETESGVFNVSEAQLLEKAKILKDAGFDKEQRREIIESGLTAAAAPPPVGIPPREYGLERNAAIADFGTINFNHPELDNIKQKILDLHNASIAAGGSGIDSESLKGYQNQWINAKESGRLVGADALLEHEFQERIREISQLDTLARGGGRAEEGFWEEAGNFQEEIARARAAGDTVRENLLTEQFRIAKGRFVGNINVSETGLRDHTLKLIVDDEEAYQRLAFKIIGGPLQSETGDYSLGFYGQINIDAMTNLLQSLSENTTDPTKRDTFNAQKEDINNIKEGVRTMHELNKYIVTGNLEPASQIAGSILPKYQQVLQKWKGVALVERLLEAAHSVTVSKDGYINIDNDQEMMGTKINKVTGKFEKDQGKSVLAEFRELLAIIKASPGLATGALTGFENMQEWEISLAYNLGRAMFNNQQRKAAWTSQGQVPAGNRAWESTPLEGFNKILNPGRWLYHRFTIGKGRGGMRWFDRFTDAMQRYKHTEGWGHTSITKIRDDKIEMFELPTMTGVRDWMASWRAFGMTLKQTSARFELQGSVAGFQVFHKEAGSNVSNNAPIDPNDTSLGMILDTGALKFNRAGEDKGWDDLKDFEQADYLRSVFYEPDTDNLRADLQSALGVVYRYVLNPAAGHHGLEKSPKSNKIKEDIRAKIWERVAEDNPLAIIPYLNKMEYGHGGGHKTFGGRDVFRDTPGVDWSILQRKLNFLNEIKLAKVRGIKNPDGSYAVAPELSFSLQNAIAHVESVRGPGYLSADEARFLEEVKTEAHHVAHDMANVKFAFAPFMNDVILEDTDYDQPGQESFRRHFGDLAQFNATNGAIAEAMDNLGLITDYHKMVEFIAKFSKGITGVHGDETAKHKAYPVIEATVAFFRRGENVIDKSGEFKGEDKLSRKQRLARWIKQQDEVHEIAQKFHKPNSEAQMYYNIKALTLDRGQIYEAMEDLAAAGLMGHDQEEDYKKRFGNKFKFWKFMIDLFVPRMIMEGLMRGTKGALTVGAAELTKRSFKGAVQ